VLPWSGAVKETPEVARFEEKTLRVVVLVVLRDFLFCIASIAYLQPR
jgi:hypothetical protein